VLSSLSGEETERTAAGVLELSMRHILALSGKSELNL
jgi:hypothetical protein